MFITRQGNKIELTRKEIQKIIANEFVECYVEWAENRFIDCNPNKKITKEIKKKFYKIAKDTWEQFQRDDEISDREYEIFSSMYSNYIKDEEG